MKTREEVETLKQNWLNDPCFDLDKVDGFDEYGVELCAFAMEHEAEWKAAYEKREAEKYRNTPATEATLRDMFAAYAMQGELACVPASEGNWPADALATRAYVIADAMMAARKAGTA